MSEIETIFSDEKLMVSLFRSKFWKQANTIETSEQHDEVARLAADLVKAIVTEDGYKEELSKHLTASQQGAAPRPPKVGG